MNASELTLRVIEVKQPIGEFYIGSVSARDLINISYSDVRRLVEDQRDVERYLGIQRPISSQRIKKIKQYIEAKDATFPTSVILAVDERCATYQEIEKGHGVLNLKPYEPVDENDEPQIPLKRIAKIIDGQHRLAAFLDDENDWIFNEKTKDFQINVSIFIGADISAQANIFATVNLAQTKVHKNLVYDLTELANTRSPHKTCHNIAVALDGYNMSPFYQRIRRLAAATPGRKKEPITQATFVEELVKFISKDSFKDRNDLLNGKKLHLASIEELHSCPFRNMFILNRETDIAEILHNYFSAVRKRFPNSWNDIESTGNLLPKSNAFKALMRYLHRDVYASEVGSEFGAIPSIEKFSKYFSHLDIDDKDFTTRNFAPGNSGVSSFYKVLKGEVRLGDITELNT